MRIAFDKFKKVLNQLQVKITQDTSCPMKQNQICLQTFNSCQKGQDDSCSQRLKFSLNNKLFDIEVLFYGEERKGFINSESMSVKNFVIKNKLSLEQLKH